MKIRDMPIGLQSALKSRGHDLDKEMDSSEALAEWSAWEIGDRYWGETAAYYLAEINKITEPV